MPTPHDFPLSRESLSPSSNGQIHTSVPQELGSVFEQYLQNNPSATVLLSVRHLEWVILYANPAFERLTGYNSADILDRPLDCLLNSEADLYPLREAVRLALNDGEAQMLLHRRGKTNGPQQCEVRISPVYDAQKQLTHLITYWKDSSAVTSRRDDEFRRAAYYQQLFFDNNRAVSLLINARTGAIVDANHAAQTYYGYSLDQLKSMRMRDISVMSDENTVRTYQQVLLNDRSAYSTRHRLFSGELREVDVYSSRMDLPEGRFLYAIVVDVTERRQAERRYQSLFEQSGDAVFIVGLDGSHLHVNQRAADMFGYTVDELLHMTSVDLVVPDEHSAAQDVMARLLAGEQPHPYERVFRHKDGSLVTTEINIELIRDEQGHPLHLQSIVRDITERKRMERALAEKYAELDRFFTVALDLLCIADNQGNFLRVNKAWESLLGYSVEELENQPYLSFVHPDDVESTLKAQAYLEGQQPLRSFVNRYRAKDGTYHYIEWRSNPYGDVLYAAARDITERKQMEDALRENEHKFRTFIEKSSDGMVLTDEDGRVIEWNSSAQHLTGIPAEDVIGRFIWDVHALMLPNTMHRQAMDERLKTQVMKVLDAGYAEWLSQTLEPVIRHPDGRETVMQARMFPIETAAGYRIGSIMRDFTDRKQMEVELRESESRLKMVVGGTRTGTWEWNIATGQTVFNERWAEIIGYALEELAPVSINTWMQHVHPDDLAVSEQVMQRHFSGEIPYYECEVRMRHKDGHWVWVWDRGRVTEWSDDGRPLRMFGMHIDITERKRVEAALRESEAKYRLIAENSSDGIAVWDEIRQQITYASPTYDSMLGLAPGETLGWDHEQAAEIIHPDDRTAVFNYIYEVAGRQGKTLTQTYRARHRDGHYIWKEDRMALSYAPDGSYLSANVISRDVTERRQAEEALKDSEARYRLLAENIRDVIIKFSPEGYRTYVSPSAYDLFGYRPEELFGRRADQLMHPEDFEVVERTIHQALESRTSAFLLTHRQRHRNGHYLWCETSVTVVRDPQTGELIELIGIVHDISIRKQMEDALRESEEKYRLIAENTSDGIMILDGLTRKVSYTSPAFDLQYGRQPGESVGMTYKSILKTIHPEDRNQVSRQIADAIERQLPRSTYVYRSLHRDGHYFWREDHTQFTYAPDGTFLTANVISRDVNARKQAEQTQIALMLETERTSVLAQFIRDAAHEFRTPLSVIGSSAYLLQRSDDPDYRRRKAEQIEIQINRITRLVEKLLLLVRLESSGHLENQPVDIVSVLKIDCDQAISHYGTKPSLYCELPPELPPVMGDARQLVDAIGQILENAFHYTPPEGMIRVTAGTDNGQVWLEVGDTGPGIPDEDIPHIFKTFWRHDDAHSTAGFGLGLPIAHRIVQRFGGTIHVKSRLGAGAQFRVSLPVMAVQGGGRGLP